MPAPTPLDVATKSLHRLVKEEASYHKELDGQKARVEKIEAEIKAGTGDENAEYVLKQEVCPTNYPPPSIIPPSHNLACSFPILSPPTLSCPQFLRSSVFTNQQRISL